MAKREKSHWLINMLVFIMIGSITVVLFPVLLIVHIVTWIMDRSNKHKITRGRKVDSDSKVVDSGKVILVTALICTTLTHLMTVILIIQEKPEDLLALIVYWVIGLYIFEFVITLPIIILELIVLSIRKKNQTYVKETKQRVSSASEKTMSKSDIEQYAKMCNAYIEHQEMMEEYKEYYNIE